MAPGSGENMNEHVTGDPWPLKETRQQRLEECVDVIRRLHAGEEVTHHGLVTVEQARIWDVPSPPPPLIAPAISVETARRAAGWADGLVTVNQPAEKAHAKCWRRTGPRAARGRPCCRSTCPGLPARRTPSAIALDQWRSNVFAPPIPWDLPTAAHFDGVSTDVGEAQVRKSVNVSASLDRHVEWLGEYLDLGFDELYLHFVGPGPGAVHRRLRGQRPAAAPEGAGGMNIAETSDLWWKTAVVYCLDVETFFDHDGDGTGDFSGLTQRVDYLAALGVNCIWLMPFIRHRTGTTATT